MAKKNGTSDTPKPRDGRLPREVAALPPLGELSGDALESEPRTIDWTVGHSDDGDDDSGWESWSAEECEECHEIVVCEAGCGGEPHRDVVGASREGEPCVGHVSLHEGPMMSYWYPLPEHGFRSGVVEGNSTDVAKRLAYLPVCLVRVDGLWGLALTGGGMDLSWEIIEAFVRLGYLPPLHWIAPPKMSGRGVSPKDRFLMRACKQSAISGIRRLRHKLGELADLRKWSDEYEAERSAK